MSITSTKCKNCGAILQYRNDKLLYCENCGSLFSEQQDITNTYINNNVTKNFYGEAAQKEIKKDKIDGLLFQVVNSISNANYSDARNCCVSIIQKDPYNWIATIFKGFIENIAKKNNGRYIKVFTIKEFSMFLEYISNDTNLVKYYDIFPYCKTLLNGLDIVADREVIMLLDELINTFENIDNDYVKDFISALKEYQEQSTALYNEKNNIEKEQERDKLSTLQQILNINVKLKLILILLIITTLGLALLFIL